MNPTPRPNRSPLAPAPLAAPALAVLALLAAQAGCVLLLRLSAFGESALPALPLAQIAFFGLLFAAPLHDALRRVEGRGLAATLAVGALASAALAAALTGFDAGGRWAYALAPAAALAVALPLRLAARPERGEMLASMVVYVACTVLATYTLDAFIPLGFALVNVGTLFFGVLFTQRDRVHRFGRVPVYAMIAAAGAINSLVAWELGTPMRYVMVGLLALVASEAVDTEVFGRLLARSWIVRVASSNAVSAPLDTLLFTLLAFWGEPWATPAVLLRIIATDVVVKYAASMVVALGLLPSRAARERAEGRSPSPA